MVVARPGDLAFLLQAPTEAPQQALLVFDDQEAKHGSALSLFLIFAGKMDSHNHIRKISGF